MLLGLVHVSFALCLLLALIAALKNSGVEQNTNGGDSDTPDQKASDKQRKITHCFFLAMTKAPRGRLFRTQAPRTTADSVSAALCLVAINLI